MLKMAYFRAYWALFCIKVALVTDPCCGSGHIAVYLFDVLMQIYETQGWTQREAAQSIVEHNLYALDIDDRAAQLAYFAVMMKARQYDRRFFTRGLQPHVYAIPEWDEETRKGWSAELRNLCNLLRDGKEFGSIIDMPEMDWNALCMEVERMADMQGQISFDSVSEETRQKLRGLIDVGQAMARNYDVVATNPPYMGSSGMGTRLSQYVKENYPDSKSDLFAVFIERCRNMAKSNGYQAMITQQAWLSLPTYNVLREKILVGNTIINLIQLGSRGFDEISGEVVSTAAYVIVPVHVFEYTGLYCDLQEGLSEKHKEQLLISCKNRYLSSQSNFTLIPNKIIAFNAPAKAIQHFQTDGALGNIVTAKPGMQTSDNDRFLRLWFEIAIRDIGFGFSHEDAANSPYKWFPYNKGIGFRKWYGNNDYVVNFYHDGEELKYWLVHNPNDPKTTHWSRNMRNYSSYFEEGITFTAIGSAFSARLNGKGYLFDTKGPMMFGERLPEVCGFVNSVVFDYYNRMLCKQITKTFDSVNLVPFANYAQATKDAISRLVETCLHNSKTDWDSFETSWDFQCHPLLDVISRGGPFFERGNIDLAECWLLWKGECEERFQQLKANEEELNRIFIDIYGLQDELTPEVEDKDVTVRRADLGRDIRSLISYAVGCMFGRYSLNKPGLAYAGGKWEDVFGTLQEPWETGTGDIITTNTGESIEFSVKNGTIKHNGQEIKLDYCPDDDNCIPITDEPYFEDDIVGRFVEFIRVVYGDASLETNLDFIAHALGNKGDTSRDVIRNYFLNDFFKDHCQTYSVTGSGKRPIYWLFDSGKANGFKALVYMHRWTADTVGNLRVEYLHRMQRVYEKEIERMQDTIDNARDSREVARATKRREKLVKQLKEARDYDAKIAHVALSRVEIDLDDGVKVNYEKVQKGPDGKSLGILAKI